MIVNAIFRAKVEAGTMVLATGCIFPEDLRDWVAGPTLLRLAQRMAQEQTPSVLRPVFSFAAPRFHHPWRMLGLVTYGYARGIWQSRALVEIAALDRALTEFFHTEPPSVEVIHRFRKRNAAAITLCLERVLRCAWCEHHDAAQVPPLVMVEIVSEARRRLHGAERSDSAAACFYKEVT